MQGALDAAGPQAAHIARLWWLALGISVVVYALTMAALLWAVLHRKRRPAVPNVEPAPDEERRGRRWVAAATGATIVKGRPHGMPSYRGRMGNSEVWKLVAYVRTLGGLTRKDAWSPRNEHLGESTPDPSVRGHGLHDSSRVHPEQLPPAPPGGAE